MSEASDEHGSPHSHGPQADTELLEAASDVRRHAYAPYTKFDAGAAVRCADGSIATGAIVENISLGLAMCAERVALFSAVTAGGAPTALALAAPSTGGGRTDPCGACLQVALELGGPDLTVTSLGEDGSTMTARVADLLPRGPFSGLKLD